MLTLVPDPILPYGFPTWAAGGDSVGLVWVGLIGWMVLASNKAVEAFFIKER